jgi:hypothetical protein
MRGFLLLSFLLCSFSFADDLNTTRFGIEGSLDIKSDSLPLNLFEKEWTTLPEHKVSNNVFGGISYEAFVGFDDFKIGIFQEKKIDISMNDGFIEMWFTASKDFSTLLGMRGIGNSLRNFPIKASVDYLESDGLYLEKSFAVNSHQLSGKIKFHHAKDIQLLRLNGSNQNGDFATTFDYYYTHKNYISKYQSDYDNGSGVGYSVDLEYASKPLENFNIYLGVINVLSSIKWSGLALMHYDLDSSKPLGDPFGIGYYKFNQKFNQTLPIYLKMKLDYQLTDTLSIGNNTDANENTHFNEVYGKTEYGEYSFKVGKVIEVNQFLFGLGKKNINFFNDTRVDINLEMTHNPSFNNNIAKILVRGTF